MVERFPHRPEEVPRTGSGFTHAELLAEKEDSPYPVTAIPVTAVPTTSFPTTGASVSPGPTFSRRNGRQTYDPLADVRRRAHQALLEQIGPQMYEAGADDAELERLVREALPGLLAQETQLTASDRGIAFRQILDEIVGHGPIESLLRDNDVTEIMVNAWDRIYVERFGRIQQVETAFLDEAHLRRIIDKIVSRVGRRVDEGSPMVDARLPDGSRVNAVIPPVSLDGAALTIRKFAANPYTIEDLIAFGTLTQPLADGAGGLRPGSPRHRDHGRHGHRQDDAAQRAVPVLPADERIITIEDAAELQLAPGARGAAGIAAAEHRGPGRGHHPGPGTQRAAHAPGPHRRRRGPRRRRPGHAAGDEHRPRRVADHCARQLAARLAVPSGDDGADGRHGPAGTGDPRPDRLRLDLIVHLTRLQDGSRRVTQVTEVLGMDGDTMTLQDLFPFDYRSGIDSYGRSQGTIRPTGRRPQFLDRLADQGVSLSAELFDVDSGRTSDPS